MGAHDTRRKSSGQILIFGAIIIMLLVFSTVIAIQASSTTYQSLRYSEVKELIGNFNEDFQRALRNTLVSMTHEYNQTAEIEIPREHAFGNFTLWMKTAIRTFASRGIQLNFSLPQEVLFNDTQGYRYAEDLVKLYWYSPKSISSILASCTINIPGLGFYGWKEETLLFLNMTIDVGSITNVNDNNDPGYNSTRVNVMVNREGGVPVDDLASSNFKVMYLDNSTAKNYWQDGTIFLLLNNGGGNYTIYLKTNDANPGQVIEPYYKYLIIWVQDARGIIVEAYSYAYIEYIIQENAINTFYPNQDKTFETYTLELLSNGTLLWFNKPITGSTVIPVPLPPIKQFHVYTTINGITDPNLIETPSQVEVWSPDYSVPTLQFSEWKARFIKGDKLVFFVNFGNQGITQQKVRISWLLDADAQPPTYLLQYPQATEKWVVDNGVYLFEMKGNYTSQHDPVGIDYTFRINATQGSPLSKYHIEFAHFHYDVYTQDGGQNYAYKYPWGPGLNQGWNFIPGPVRAVVFRSSNWTYDSVHNQYISGTNAELNHTEIILIPFNVSYFLFYFNASALKNINMDNMFVAYPTMLGGTCDDNIPNSLRPKYATIQLTGGVSVTINATYENLSYVPCPQSAGANWYISYPNANKITAQSIGYWMAEYSSSRGQAMMFDDATISALKAKNSREITAWITSNGNKRILGLDYAYFRAPISITTGTPFKFSMAGWYYDLNNAGLSDMYRDQTLWQADSDSANLLGHTSTGYTIPAKYYRMFVEQYAPTIIMASAGWL